MKVTNFLANFMENTRTAACTSKSNGFVTTVAGPVLPFHIGRGPGSRSKDAGQVFHAVLSAPAPPIVLFGLP